MRQWLQPLERLARHCDVTILYVSHEVTPLLAGSSVRGARIELPDGLVEFLNRTKPRLLLYPNQNVRNFYALRYGGGVHAWVSHGESEKAYMFQNTLKRYDFYFAAGRAALERVAANIAGYDTNRIRLISRPQLADKHEPPADFVPSENSRPRIFYAPTWEGVTGSTRYSSISSHGEALVRGLIERGFQVVYRPHPLSGTRDRDIARANRRIKNMLREANRAATETGIVHRIDVGEFGWQLETLDLMITDVSAVAYDWLPTSKPLVVTTPIDDRAVIIDSPLFERVARLEMSGIDDFVARLASEAGAVESPMADAGVDAGAVADAGANAGAAKELSAYYFESFETPDAGFLKAVDEALEIADDLPVNDDLELFLPRGRRLGWLRYPNYLLRQSARLFRRWQTVSEVAQLPRAEILYAHFSDPFDFDSLKHWVPVLEGLLANGEVHLATNQVTTKLYLNRRLASFSERLHIIPCVSTADSEQLLREVRPKEVRYLKDHPTNLAAMRTNGINHVLYRPEVDPFFKVSHSLVMYDEIDTQSPSLTGEIKKILTISQPNMRQTP